MRRSRLALAAAFGLMSLALACPHPRARPCVDPRESVTCTEESLDGIWADLMILIISAHEELPNLDLPEAFTPVAPPLEARPMPLGPGPLPPPVMGMPKRYPSFIGPPPQCQAAGGCL